MSSLFRDSDANHYYKNYLFPDIDFNEVSVDAHKRALLQFEMLFCRIMLDDNWSSQMTKFGRRESDV